MASARIGGGWQLPQHVERPVGTPSPTRIPLSRSERDLIRLSREELRLRRHGALLGPAAAGPRRVCRLGPSKSGIELPKLMHHPRSSLPSHYGYSLHASKRVTGIDVPKSMCF